jgi:hypothetical protein
LFGVDTKTVSDWVTRHTPAVHDDSDELGEDDVPSVTVDAADDGPVTTDDADELSEAA